MEAPTGTVTLFFADAEGAPGAGSGVRSALAARGGFEVKSSGTTWMAAFPRASDAVAAALQAQESERGRLRIGIATGDVIVEVDPATGRADYFGPTVNRAARIMAAGHAGQTLLSETARAAAGGVELVDLGEHRLRGIDRAERIFQAAAGGREFPPLRTLRTFPSNLPPQTSSFVGREAEVRALGGLLEEARVVTVTGSAGVGKTRLAVRAAAEWVSRLAGGVWFADVAESGGAEGIAGAMAEALGTSPGANPVATVGSVLEMRGPILVVLDTFDPHLAAAPATVGAWLERAPKARFLLTSRAATGLPGERELRLDPLPAADAVKLFAERAREARPDFEPSRSAEDVETICAELEGSPLAIELAAARVRILQPAEIVKKLGQKFQLLRSARKDTAPRQQTLLAAIEWSEEQLAPWERSALRQYSVFRGGCSAAAADAVIDVSAHAGAPAGSAAARSLVARSLLTAVETDGGTRFRISRIVQEYAAARLEEGGLEGRLAAEERHARWCLSLAAHIETMAKKDSRDYSANDIENFFAAQDRLEAAGGRSLDVARIVAATRGTFHWKGAATEAPARFERARNNLTAADIAADPRTAVLLTMGLLRMLRSKGLWKESHAATRDAVALARALPGSNLLAEALWEEAYITGTVGDHGRSREALAESGVIARQNGDAIRRIMCLHLESVNLHSAGDVRAALAKTKEALEIGEKQRREDVRAECRNAYANSLSEADDPRGAIENFRIALAIDERLGNEAGQALRRGNLGDAFADVGDYAGALESYARAAEIDRRLGRRAYVAYGLIREAAARCALGDPDRSLSLLDAAREELERLSSPQLGATWRLRRLEALFAKGDFGLVADGFRSAMQEAEQDRDVPKRIGAAALGARALVRLGRAAEARKALQEALPAGIPALATLELLGLKLAMAEAAAALGEGGEAAREAAEARRMVESLVGTHGPENAAVRNAGRDLDRLASQS